MSRMREGVQRVSLLKQFRKEPRIMKKIPSCFGSWSNSANQGLIRLISANQRNFCIYRTLHDGRSYDPSKCREDSNYRVCSQTTLSPDQRKCLIRANQCQIITNQMISVYTEPYMMGGRMTPQNVGKTQLIGCVLRQLYPQTTGSA